MRFVFAFAFFALIASVRGQNNLNGFCETVVSYTLPALGEWQNVTYSVAPDVKPLGYRLATTYGYAPYCIQITNIRNKMVEIAAQTINGGSPLCFSDQPNELSPIFNVRRCGMGEIATCFPESLDMNTMTVAFYVKNDPEAIVDFHFRVRVSNVRTTDDQNDAVNNANMWCAMLDQGETLIYPKDLINLNLKAADGTPFTGRDGSASSIATMIALIASMLVAVSLAVLA